MLLSFASSELSDLDAALAFAESDERARAAELSAQLLPRCAQIHMDRARSYAACRALLAGKVADATLQAAE